MTKLNSAILSIYDCALDINRWSETLDTCVDFAESYSATLMFSETSSDNDIQWACVGGELSRLDPKILDFYNANLMHYEMEAWEVVQNKPRQTLIKDNDVWKYPDSVLLEREEYHYMYHRMGLLRRVAARLNNFPVWSDNIAFQFNTRQSIIPESSLESIGLLLPHVAKSIELGRSFEMLRQQYNAVLAALDYVDVGICIALDDGTIIVCNSEAQRIFDHSDGLSLTGRKTIKCQDPEASLLIAEAMCNVASTLNGEGSVAEQTLTVNKRGSAGSYLLELSPLRDSLGELDSSLSGIFIMIIDPDSPVVVDIDKLATAYKFSKVERLVARYLVDGISIPEIAEVRNVSIDTIKTQTASIMRKTDTHKRSELLRLSLKLSPPIRSASNE